MEIRPISLAKANAFVEQYHRHHGKKTGCKFAVSLWDGEKMVGVAIAGNPVARNADDGMTLEINRVCTDGTRNACSMLYSACCRAARAMGYRKVITYILESENGSSLLASGFHFECVAGAKNWNNSERQRQRNAQPEQVGLFEKKRPPEEMKKRYSIIFKS